MGQRIDLMAHFPLPKRNVEERGATKPMLGSSSEKIWSTCWTAPNFASVMAGKTSTPLMKDRAIVLHRWN